MVLLSWCDDPADPHHAVSRDAEARLLAAGDARGRRLRVEPIPMPTPMFLTDAAAAAIRSGLFPTHEIVMLPSREILLGGGNIHCVTQQQPAVARG